MEIFGLKMAQQGVKPTNNQVESLSEYPAPKSLRDMRGFMGLLNQSTFCLSKRSRELMENLKDRLKTTETRKWTGADQK